MWPNVAFLAARHWIKEPVPRGKLSRKRPGKNFFGQNEAFWASWSRPNHPDRIASNRTPGRKAAKIIPVEQSSSVGGNCSPPTIRSSYDWRKLWSLSINYLSEITAAQKSGCLAAAAGFIGTSFLGWEICSSGIKLFSKIGSKSVPSY